GRPDLAETVARLTAFADAGADCVYAPGIRTADGTSLSPELEQPGRSYWVGVELRLYPAPALILPAR
ncbi:MAG: hypothetical protein ABL900_19275, partial [Burkholderiaceae bacterium]